MRPFVLILVCLACCMTCLEQFQNPFCDKIMVRKLLNLEKREYIVIDDNPNNTKTFLLLLYFISNINTDTTAFRTITILQPRLLLSALKMLHLQTY